MLQKKMSIISLFTVVGVVGQLLLHVFSSVILVLAMSSINIENIENNVSYTQDGIGIEQEAKKLSETQIEVTTKVKTTEELSQILLIQTPQEQFNLQHDPSVIQVDEIQIDISKVELSNLPVNIEDSSITLNLENSTVDIKSENTIFLSSESEQTLLLVGKNLQANKVYAFTVIYDINANSNPAELSLFKSETLQYQSVNSMNDLKKIDISTMSPSITLTTPQDATSQEAEKPNDPSIDVPSTPDDSISEGSSIVESPGQDTVDYGIVLPEKESEIFPAIASFTPLVENDLGLEKTATLQSNGEYVVNLTVNGNPTIVPPTEVDIVMILDDSGSMAGTSLTNLKIAAKNFVTSLVTTDTDVRISLLRFNTNATLYQGWSSNASDLNTKIDAITAAGGTNTQDAYIKANTQLKTARTGAQKYIILFTDGFPTFYNQPCNAGTTNPYLGSLGVCGPGGNTTAVEISKTITAYNTLVSDNYGVETYAIGLFTTSDANAQATAKGLLYQLQNQETTQQAYSDKYFTNNPTTLNTIFTNLATTIKGKIYTEMAYKTYISDVVTGQFSLASNPNFRYINHLGQTVTLTEVSGTPDVGQVQRVKVKCDNISTPGTTTDDCDKIVVNLGTIQTPKIQVLFNVKARDPYYGSYSGGTDTNVRADISFTGILDNLLYNREFPIPKVDLPFIQGSITVVKDINNYNSDQKFNILVEGVNTTQKFGFDVQEGVANSEVLQFYLKDVNTDIQPNIDYSKGYVTIGQFTVKEIVPENYELVSVQYCYDSNATTAGCQGTWQSGNFTLNKDTPHIYILVTNKVVNNTYWYDRAELENNLPYTYLEPVVAWLSRKDENLDIA